MAARNILVYGGRGALGSYCVKHFRELNYNVLSIDIAANKEAHSSIIVDASDSFELQSARALDSLEHALGGSRIKAVLCVAGGWAGGNALSPDFISSTDQMLRSSVWPAAISTAAAARHLEEGGLLVLTGSSACLSGTPGMLGYGMAKAALHQLTTSLACPDAGLPTGAVVSAILAATIDTERNRKFAAAGTDFGSWTPLPHIAKLLQQWTEGQQRVPSGSLVKLLTSQGITKTEIAHA